MALGLALLPLTVAARAQDNQSPVAAPEPVNPCVAVHNAATETRTFYLTNVTQQNDGNEIMVAIRNMLCPSIRIYYDAAQNAIIIAAPSSQLAIAEKLITELDRPRKTYRLTYTITELDGDKTIGTQHYSMVVVTGQHTTMKEGNKIPVATGSYDTDKATSQTQFTYLDIGMNFDATVDEFTNGVRLQSKVEQSSLGQPSTIAGVTEPVVRQTVLQGTSFLSPGKPVMLGSIDVPSSTRHFDIVVVLDQVK
jgi:type II secretory pathway component GspD/PulD (secretin)